MRKTRAEELRDRLLKVGLDVEFDDRHYSRAHVDVKALVNLLVSRLESKEPGFRFTTKELEYMVYYLRGVENLVVSNLVVKALNEINRRKASPPDGE